MFNIIFKHSDAIIVPTRVVVVDNTPLSEHSSWMLETFSSSNKLRISGFLFFFVDGRMVVTCPSYDLTVPNMYGFLYLYVT